MRQPSDALSARSSPVVKAGRCFVQTVGLLVLFSVARTFGLLGQPAVSVGLLVLALVLVAWSAGASLDDLGLGRADVPAGLCYGAGAVGVVLLVLLVAALIPATNGFLHDSRAAISGARLAYELGVSIVLLTAIPEHVGDHVERAVPRSAEVGGGHADQHRDDRGEQAHPERDQQHRPGAVHHLGEHVLPERRRAQPVLCVRGQAARVDLGLRIVVRDKPGKQPHEDKQHQQRGADGGLAVRGDGAGHPPQRAGPGYPARARQRDPGRRRTGRAWSRTRTPSARLTGPGRVSQSGHGQLAALVGGSSMAVATAEIRIATSTATLSSRNSACTSG